MKNNKYIEAVLALEVAEDEVIAASNALVFRKGPKGNRKIHKEISEVLTILENLQFDVKELAAEVKRGRSIARKKKR
jgi:hypothetical protein